MTRVLVLERDPMTARLLAERLGRESDLEVAGTAVAGGGSPAGDVDTGDADVVVARHDPDGDGVLALLARLRRTGSVADVVVTGVGEHPSVALRYMEAGAVGFVPDDAPLESLVDVVRAAAREECLLSPGVVYRMVRRLAELSELCARNGLDPSRLRRLTPREREVLRLLGKGLSNREIADRIYVEVGTVKTHVHHLLDKLEVDNREQAARYLAMRRHGGGGDEGGDDGG